MGPEQKAVDWACMAWTGERPRPVPGGGGEKLGGPKSHPGGQRDKLGYGQDRRRGSREAVVTSRP